MIKDCRDCKFFVKDNIINKLRYDRADDKCRLFEKSISFSRKFDGCGIEEAKYFTPKEYWLFRLLKFIGLR